MMKYFSLLFIYIFLVCSCSSNDAQTQQESNVDTIAVNDAKAARILQQKPDAKWNQPQAEFSSGTEKKLEVNFHGKYADVFNDSNYVQLEAANAVGITPISDMASAWNVKRPLELIASCEEYYLEELTHSFPYLVPEGAKLVKDIGARFNQLLWERGKSKYRIKVTSVLRTPETIKSLMKVNKNSVSNSAHSYGTTVDISYSKFILDQSENPRTFENLAALLAEVLHEFQSQGRCYVKYESKQSCFHLTVRPQK